MRRNHTWASRQLTYGQLSRTRKAGHRQSPIRGHTRVGPTPGPHRAGHGFDLEIHEPPRISKNTDLLQAGHIVTNEPGLYYPELGGGIRIEDNTFVTEEGYVNLTQIEKIFEV